MASSASNVPANQAAKALYEILVKDPSATHFKVLPDPIIYADYFAVISRPVCLADLWKFMNESRYTLSDAQRDLRRMIANAKRYNRPDAPVYQDALSLEARSEPLVAVHNVHVVTSFTPTYISETLSVNPCSVPSAVPSKT